MEDFEKEIKTYESVINKAVKRFKFMKDYSEEDLKQEAYIVLFNYLTTKENQEDYLLNQRRIYVKMLILNRFGKMYEDYIKFHNMENLIENRRRYFLEANKKYREKHREEYNEKARIRMQKYREENHDYMIEYWKEYREKNRERIKKYQKERYQKIKKEKELKKIGEKGNI